MSYPENWPRCACGDFALDGKATCGRVECADGSRALGQLAATARDLSEWALVHGPDHLRYAAERNFSIKSGVMDHVADLVAAALGGRVARPGSELVRWRARMNPSVDAIQARIEVLELVANLTDLPKAVELRVSDVQRIEEQSDPTDPHSIVKYTGVVVTLRHPATQDRFVVVNLEAR